MQNQTIIDNNYKNNTRSILSSLKTGPSSSPGKLNLDKNKSNTPGILNTHITGDFSTKKEIYQIIEIDKIQPFADIPDYQTPTNLPYPSIVQIQTQFICIDGWNIIENAKVENQASIECHVYLIENFSPIELALRKVATRSMPYAGISSYGEIIRNIRLLYQKIKNTDENPVAFSHGGARRGHTYLKNSPENDIRTLLSERLGKCVSKINTLLNYGDKINDRVLNILAENKASRRFFEAVNRNKGEKIKRLQHDGIQGDELIEQISKDVLSWFQDHFPDPHL